MERLAAAHPVILLPGMMCDERLFAPLLNTRAFAGRDVIIPDITRHETIGAIAESVLESVPAQFILGGLSMGGIVAMEMLRQSPDSVTGLILMDTNPLAESEKSRAKRDGQIELVKRGKLSEVGLRKLIPLYLHAESKRDDLVQLCLEMMMDCGDAVFLRQSLALRDRADQTATLKAYKGPALILHGEDDRMCPPARHELMHRCMPHAGYRIIKGAGHLPTLEAPDATADALAAFLDDA